jgi:hypothetical protein
VRRTLSLSLRIGIAGSLGVLSVVLRYFFWRQSIAGWPLPIGAQLVMGVNAPATWLSSVLAEAGFIRGFLSDLFFALASGMLWFWVLQGLGGRNRRNNGRLVQWFSMIAAITMAALLSYEVNRQFSAMMGISTFVNSVGSGISEQGIVTAIGSSNVILWAATVAWAVILLLSGIRTLRNLALVGRAPIAKSEDPPVID